MLQGWKQASEGKASLVPLTLSQMITELHASMGNPLLMIMSRWLSAGRPLSQACAVMFASSMLHELVCIAKRGCACFFNVSLRKHM